MLTPFPSITVTLGFSWKKKCARWTWKWVKSSQHKTYKSKPTRIPLLFVRTTYGEGRGVNAAFSRSTNMRFKMNAYTRKNIRQLEEHIDFCVHLACSNRIKDVAYSL